jgi:hypothetical protein
LKTLLLQAFDVEDADLRGPNWLDDQFVELNAVMPVETTREQFRVMLLNLLAERFKLTIRREAKESSGYNLVVAKNGPKMTEVQGDMPLRDEEWVPKTGKDGFMIPRRGQQLFVESGRLRSRWTFLHVSAQQLAGWRCLLLVPPAGKLSSAPSLSNQFGQTIDDLIQFHGIHFPCPFSDPVDGNGPYLRDFYPGRAREAASWQCQSEGKTRLGRLARDGHCDDCAGTPVEMVVAED